VLLAGGVNGAATLAVLPLGALWLALQPAGPVRRRLAAWWSLAVLAATAWWLGPLLVLGRYSPPFLDVIESASTTTHQTGLWAVLTGNDLWLQYLDLAGPARPAGWLLVTEAALVLCTTAVAALGLAGLATRSMPHRGFLVGGLLLGLVVVGAGHVGALDGPLAEWQRDLLDGPLAAFRNVHKYDALVRLPVVLGLAHLAATTAGQVREPAAAAHGRGRPAPVARPAAVLAALAVLGAATPALGRLQPPGSWDALPGYWEEVARHLDAVSTGPAPTRALLVPAAPAADYVWGRPHDEPLQPLARSPWVVRDAVPLGGPGVTRVLDAVEEVLRSGRGSPALAAYLARAGVGRLVVRHDLDLARTGAPPPFVVQAALAASPGLRREAAFGPPSAGVAAAVEVYTVHEGSESAGGPSAVTTWPRAGTQRVSGGPESLLPLLEQGVVGVGTAVRLAGEPATPGDADELRTLTDGYRWREVDVGRAGDNASATLGAGARPRLDRPVSDYLPVPADGARTRAVLAGLTAATASSSAADADALLVRGRDHHAAAAFDGDGATSWVSGGVRPRGQWVEARFPPRQLRAVEVVVPLVPGTVPPTRVRVSTDAGSADLDVAGGTGRVDLPGQTSRVRVEVLAVARTEPLAVTTLEVGLLAEGARVVGERGLRLPDDGAVATGGRPADPRTAVVLSAGRRDRPACLELPDRPACSPVAPLGDEDDDAVDRTWVLDAPSVMGVSLRARARAGEALDALLDRGRPVRVTASSTAVPHPHRRPATVLDGDVTTGWSASPLDGMPTLTLRLPAPRRVEGLVLTTHPATGAARPTAVTVRVDDGPVRSAVVDRGGEVSLPGDVGSTVEIVFTGVEQVVGLRPDGLPGRLPVGVSELRLLGPGPALTQPVRSGTPVLLPCGEGPALQLDGALLATTRVDTTVGELLGGADLVVRSCGGPVALAAGEHRLRVARTATLQPTSVVLRDLGRPAPAQAPSRVAGTPRWESTHRLVEVTPGPEAWLVVHEAFNEGWQAELAGRALRAVRLDGWQQGFVLPEGVGGRVTLRFAPDRPYRAALVLGSGLALLLLAAALWPARSPRRDLAAAGSERRAPVVGLLLAGGALALVAGVAGLVAVLAAVLARRVVPGLFPGLFPGRFLHRAAPWVAGGALLLAGTVVAVRPWPATALLDAPVQALCLLAVAGLVVTLVPARGVPGDPAPGPGAASPAPRRPARWPRRPAG